MGGAFLISCRLLFLGRWDFSLTSWPGRGVFSQILKAERAFANGDSLLRASRLDLSPLFRGGGEGRGGEGWWGTELSASSLQLGGVARFLSLFARNSGGLLSSVKIAFWVRCEALLPSRMILVSD